MTDHRKARADAIDAIKAQSAGTPVHRRYEGLSDAAQARRDEAAANPAYATRLAHEDALEAVRNMHLGPDERAGRSARFDAPATTVVQRAHDKTPHQRAHASDAALSALRVETENARERMQESILGRTDEAGRAYREDRR